MQPYRSWGDEENARLARARARTKARKVRTRAEIKARKARIKLKLRLKHLRAVAAIIMTQLTLPIRTVMELTMAAVPLEIESHPGYLLMLRITVVGEERTQE